ncbi:hypothetical protein LAZ67_1007009 [Cordylochernes scorpioides]|uniref:Uncharacterized protein n=1 Tax=Cordylochernes scorpioides TaxID=51811 RepID=A0ABY6K0S4_9ARAC|nr:hypothetical protein LAZ67_1007009 [Cordylochernes scorpioides]
MDTPFEFKRLQFLLGLAFAMTINKAQGQSLQVCGLNLINPCFSHGQLYVGCSRVGKPSNLFVLAPDRKTKNVAMIIMVGRSWQLILLASLRGAANGYSWLVHSRAWLTPPAPDVWHSPRRRRLLSLWDGRVLELDHRVLHPAILRSLRLRGDNRFLQPPDLAPEHWLQATVGDFSDGALP